MRAPQARARRRGRGALLLGLALAGAALPASAFVGKEHDRMSMAALAMARRCMADEMCRKRLGGLDCGDLRLSDGERFALERLSGAEDLSDDPRWSEGPQHAFTYGDLVRDVDFVLDPLALLVSRGEVAGLPQWPRQLDEYAVWHLGESTLGHLSAAQVNDTHFQDQLMVSWWQWHRAAVEAAAGRRGEGGAPLSAPSLFSALLMNAVSSHFIEDFFAPGHVTTPRSGMHDFSALSMHDHYNRVGAEFRIARGSELAALLDPAQDAARLGIEEQRLAEIQRLIVANGSLHLRGDGYLTPVLSGAVRGSGVNDIQARAQEEAAFITLVVARSILDVFQSFSCGEYVNTFPEYHWHPVHKYGKNEERPDTETGRPAKFRMAQGGLAFGEYAERNVRRLKYGLMMPLEFSVQSAARADRESTRGIVSVFLLPVFLCEGCSLTPGSFKSGQYEPRLLSPTFGLGAHYRFDEELGGAGVYARAGLLLLRLDLHVALGLGLEHYEWDGNDTWRFHPELRAGLGRSFVNYILAVGYDHDLDTARKLDGALVFRAGITVGVPWGKLADWVVRR